MYTLTKTEDPTGYMNFTMELSDDSNASTGYAMTISEIVVHRVNSNYCYGDGSITVRLEDEGGGAFITLTQAESVSSGVRVDLEELDLVVKAARQLMAQNPIANAASDS